MNFLHLCERTDLALTTDPVDFGVISGEGGLWAQNLGTRSNSEADLIGNSAFCGLYTDATITSTYPASISLLTTTDPWTLQVNDPAGTEFGTWSVTLEFSLVNYPTRTYSQTFTIHACEGLFT